MGYHPRKFVVKNPEIEVMGYLGDFRTYRDVTVWLFRNWYPYLQGDATEPETLVGLNGEVNPQRGHYIDPKTGLLVVRIDGFDNSLEPPAMIVKRGDEMFISDPESVYLFYKEGE